MSYAERERERRPLGLEDREEPGSWKAKSNGFFPTGKKNRRRRKSGRRRRRRVFLNCSTSINRVPI
jgi:hypothetical protein